jgi:hypothetical protein
LAASADKPASNWKFLDKLDQREPKEQRWDCYPAQAVFAENYRKSAFGKSSQLRIEGASRNSEINWFVPKLHFAFHGIKNHALGKFFSIPWLKRR